MSVLDGLQFGLRRRLPMILQTEAAECGIASLAMVAGYLGYHTDLADIRRRFGVSMKGATLEDLMRVAERILRINSQIRQLEKTIPICLSGLKTRNIRAESNERFCFR